MSSRKIGSLGLALLVVVPGLVVGLGPSATQATPSLSVDDSTTPAGGVTSTDVTLDSSDGLQQFNITVTIVNGSVADIQGVQGRALSGPMFQVVSRSSDSVTIRGADLLNTVQESSRSVTVATLYVNNTAPGETSLRITSASITTDNGETLTPVTHAGSLVVSQSDPFETSVSGFGSTAPPTDPDDDGLFEDVNGDGKTTVIDPITLVSVRTEALTAAQIAALDFNNNGKIGYIDAVTLAVELL